jgi:ubiquinone/menaquinone biosynthesis C-methylase UbiE
MRRGTILSAVGCVGILVLMTSMLPGLNSSRDARLQPERVMDVVGVKTGMRIGEGGAGKGYLTFKLAKRVGDTGHVYANDISGSALKAVENRCRTEGVKNITTVMGEVSDPLFPERNLDMIIMLHALHDFEDQEGWLENVQQYMKPGATLVLIEAHNYHTRFDYETVKELGERTGFSLVQYETFLTRDFIYVFRLAGSEKN